MRAFIESCVWTVRHIPVGLAYADTNRGEHALYFGCRGDATDELENAEYIGINAYQHCDGTSAALPGYELLLSDFAGYNLTVPVIVSEFGCLSRSFPTIDGYEGQRDFVDVDALFSSRYREEFVGGAVFEYSTELINSLSPYPFVTYGEGNYGIGYFTPEDCDEITTPCVYEPFPQFTTLATKYDAVDTSDEPNLKSYNPANLTFPTCPSLFPPLSNFTWPSASVADLSCPGIVYVECTNANVPAECSNLGIQSLTPMTPSPAAPAASPTKAPTRTNTTNAPGSGGGAKLTDAPSNGTSSNDTRPTNRPSEFMRPVAPTPSARAPVRAPVVVAVTPPTTSSSIATTGTYIAGGSTIWLLLSTLCVFM
jgi:1,3-beta-glucanosyltransferase GAS5